MNYVMLIDDSELQGNLNLGEELKYRDFYFLYRNIIKYYNFHADNIPEGIYNLNQQYHVNGHNCFAIISDSPAFLQYCSVDWFLPISRFFGFMILYTEYPDQYIYLLKKEFDHCPIEFLPNLGYNF